MRFMGRSSPKIDEKGRLFLPAKYRETLMGGVVLTAGQEDCLRVFTPEAFDRRSDEAMSSPATDAKAREYQRLFFSFAEEVQPDKQGRISIPAHLREYAGLDRRTVVLGAGVNLEIWDADRWSTYYDRARPGYSELNTREL